MIEFTKTSTGISIREVCSAIVNQTRKVAFVLFFLALVITVQPHSVDAATLGSVGLKHQAEGTIDQVAGKAESKLDQTKGMARQAQGKATRDIGRVESKAEGIKNKTDEVIDDGKNILDNLGDKIQSTASDIADSVKGLAK
jgi:uncharacterized protein YjbJ (UPF0337 family)